MKWGIDFNGSQSACMRMPGIHGGEVCLTGVTYWIWNIQKLWYWLLCVRNDTWQAQKECEKNGECESDILQPNINNVTHFKAFFPVGKTTLFYLWLVWQAVRELTETHSGLQRSASVFVLYTYMCVLVCECVGEGERGRGCLSFLYICDVWWCWHRMWCISFTIPHGRHIHRLTYTKHTHIQTHFLPFSYTSVNHNHCISHQLLNTESLHPSTVSPFLYLLFDIHSHHSVPLRTALLYMYCITTSGS